MSRRRVPQIRSVNPIPVGAAFIAFMLVLLYIAFNVNALPFLGAGKTYTAAFAEAAGLHKGDSIRVAGIHVGQVTKIELDGTQVNITFTVKKVELTDEVRAEISIFTLLGNKYIALEPGHGEAWPEDKTIPLERTTVPYDVTQAFQDVSDTVDAIDTKQLARAFDTISTTFRDSPPAVRAMLDGLGRLSQSVASRDRELGSLIDNAAGVTDVLADRRDELATLLGDGSLLLQSIREREAAIDALLTHSRQLARELRGLVQDNEAQIGPMLSDLHNVVSILEDGQSNLQDIVQRLFIWTRRNIETIGTGAYFDGEVVNFTNPFDNLGDLLSTTGRNANGPPKTFGDLLGVPERRP